jgi:hypothetical protein
MATNTLLNVGTEYFGLGQQSTFIAGGYQNAFIANNRQYYLFTSTSGIGTISVSTPIAGVEVFAVGGGGGGGSQASLAYGIGGGGAGGLQTNSSTFSLSTQYISSISTLGVGTYTIYVGTGGAASADGNSTLMLQNTSTIVRSLGGGGAGFGGAVGDNGGCGGGGGYQNQTNYNGGTGSQGYSGSGGVGLALSTGRFMVTGGGGGGGIGGIAGTAIANSTITSSTIGGAGGSGLAYPNGTIYTWGGGGAGNTLLNYCGTTSTIGGPALGASGLGGNGGVYLSTTVRVANTIATANTGSGGGGMFGAGGVSVNGSAGVFIISYPLNISTISIASIGLNSTNSSFQISTNYGLTVNGIPPSTNNALLTYNSTSGAVGYESIVNGFITANGTSIVSTPLTSVTSTSTVLVSRLGGGSLQPGNGVVLPGVGIGIQSGVGDSSVYTYKVFL